MEIKKHYCEVMDIVDKLFVTMFDSLNASCKKELEAIGRQYPFEPLKVATTFQPAFVKTGAGSEHLTWTVSLVLFSIYMMGIVAKSRIFFFDSFLSSLFVVQD
ncbi:uncharacterized protein LOC115664352 isoform X1 [Syzygium oleosum]|uniref:uncharacterized protein LOC115664352 isoform X1 n=1 Tax=Syzygium oleosum TaxID=219896 RepID=UPI0024B90761|nr:uncharacterized protein LOC115664352 isoform X1 [Syzygium oleosum]